jgi:hypothetical protein
VFHQPLRPKSSVFMLLPSTVPPYENFLFYIYSPKERIASTKGKEKEKREEEDIVIVEEGKNQPLGRARILKDEEETCRG